jgi:hypothetical protein
MAGALVALLFNFGLQAAASAHGVRAAFAYGNDDDVLVTRALLPWLALKLAAELGGPALASGTRNGCAGATLLVFGHTLFNTATRTRLAENSGGTYRVDASERRWLVANGAAMTALGVVAWASDTAGGPPALALAASIAFTVGAGCWLLYRTGRRVLELLLEGAFGSQRC